MNAAAEKFKEFFEIEKPRGYGQWNDLSKFHPQLRDQLQLFQETFNLAMVNANTDLPPFHVDYVDGENPDALAFRYGGYSFIAITKEIVFRASDVSNDLSTSPMMTQTLGVRYSVERFNQLQGVLVATFLAFTVSHEFGHHKYGHVWDSGMGSSMRQVDELLVDGFAIYLLLAEYVEKPNVYVNTFRELRLHPNLSSEQQMLFAMFIAIAGFFLSRPLRRPNYPSMSNWPHPLQLARLRHLRQIAVERLSSTVPHLGILLINNFGLLMKTTALVMLEPEGYEAWQKQIEFLETTEGDGYCTALANHFEQERSKASALSI